MILFGKHKGLDAFPVSLAADGREIAFDLFAHPVPERVVRPTGAVAVFIWFGIADLIDGLAQHIGQRFGQIGKGANARLAFQILLEKADLDTPVLGHSGAHIIHNSFDEDGNLVEARYFDVDGQLRRPGTGGFEHSIVQFGYNESGQRISEHYLDNDAEATHGPYGFHEWQGTWDPVRGLLVETRFFDEVGEPVLKQYGYHMWRAEYDDRGYRVAQSYYGVDRNPVLREEGHHRIVNEYDRFGQRVETRNFGVNLEPVLRFGSHFIWRAEYDVHGNRTSVTVFNIEGQPANHANGGYHRLEMEYDALGVEVSRRAFDARGRELDG